MADALEVPARVVDLPAARARFGARADRLVEFLGRQDPLADEAAAVLDEEPAQARALERGLAAAAPPRGAAPALRRLLEEAARLPFWVDLPRCDRAGRLLLRAGPLGGVVLGARSLAAGYCSPAGNKPLALSGQLTSGRLAGKRLAETGRFVVATCTPGGLRPGGLGWQLALRVRLIHAAVRRLVLASGRWRADLWGVPINQHDLVGTTLLFSLEWLDGVRALGLSVSDEEAEDYLHLWRASGWITGVDPELLPATVAEARALRALILATEGPPDEDSRSLVRALVELPREQARTELERRLAAAQVQLGYALLRRLLGSGTADQLALPRTAWRLVVPAARPLVRGIERARAWVPGVEDLLAAAGRVYWEQAITGALAGARPTFARPSRLAGAAPQLDALAAAARGQQAG